MKSKSSTECHSLEPFIPEGAKIFLCGAFPPQREKWSMDFFYPNFINDMWRIFGYVFYGNKNYFVDDEKKSFKLDLLKESLSSLKIAVFDAAVEVCRTKGNASDKFLEIIKPVDLPAIMSKMPDCKYIITTGEKASSVIASLTESEMPKVGAFTLISVNDLNHKLRNLIHYRMPSSSRAYPLKLEAKAEYYKVMFKEIGIL